MQNVEAGRTGLPAPRPGRVWALVDSGAEPHAANHKKHFINTILTACEADGHDVGADGSPIRGGGLFTVSFSTSAGNSREVEFRDANVAFPILSTGRITDAGYTVTYNKHGGKIVCDDTGEEDTFIRALGVYWLEMIIDPALLTNPVPMGFVGHA